MARRVWFDEVANHDKTERDCWVWFMRVKVPPGSYLDVLAADGWRQDTDRNYWWRWEEVR